MPRLQHKQPCVSNLLGLLIGFPLHRRCQLSPLRLESCLGLHNALVAVLHVSSQRLCRLGGPDMCSEGIRGSGSQAVPRRSLGVHRRRWFDEIEPLYLLHHREDLPTGRARVRWQPQIPQHPSQKIQDAKSQDARIRMPRLETQTWSPRRGPIGPPSRACWRALPVARPL